MLQFLAPLLGGLGGMLFPAAGAAGAAAAGGAAATGIGALLSKVALPAIGAGLGTLAVGGGGKDAIRNALLMGAGAGLFPGVGEAVRGSEMGRNITGGLASLFGMAAPPPQMPASAASAPPPRPARRAPLTLPGAVPAPDAVAAPSGPFPPFPGAVPAGPSGMEVEAASSRRPVAMPSITEMAAMDQNRLQDRAVAGFDIAQMFPTTDAGRLPSMVVGRPEGLEVSGIPYGSMSGVRPEGLEVPPGMTTDAGNLALARQRYYGTEVMTPEARQAAIDLLIARRSPRLTQSMLLPSFAEGGAIEGPGTGTSDSVPAMIYQDGKPVSKAALSDGEFVMTAKAVKGAGNGDRDRGISRMYELMRRFERGEMA